MMRVWRTKIYPLLELYGDHGDSADLESKISKHSGLVSDEYALLREGRE